MNNERFHCHPSIIIENLGKSGAALVALLFFNILPNLPDIMDKGFSSLGGKSVLFIIGVILLIIIVTIWQILIYRKTWITVSDDTITLERLTINRKVNTIGIRNISNINLEQNIFEMIIGTCRVKLDTNSQSTAEETDINIVLKKDFAVLFRDSVLGKTTDDASKDDDFVATKGQAIEEPIDYDVSYGIDEILRHCLYTLNIFTLVILLAIIVCIAYLIATFGIDSTTITDIASFFGGLFVIACTVASIIRGFVIDFFRYYNFKAKRQGDNLYLSYGLLKKCHYTLPVNKINAVEISAPVISRIFDMQHVNLICIGLGDDDNEESLLLLSEKSSKIAEKLKILLPEFAFTTDSAKEMNYARREKNSLLTSISGIIWLTILFVGLSGTILTFKPFGIPTFIYYVAVFLLAFFWISYMAHILLSFKVEGVATDDNILTLIYGAYTKTITRIPYGRIQKLEFDQGPFGRHYGYGKGSVTILADAANQTHPVPALPLKYYDEIHKRILE